MFIVILASLRFFFSFALSSIFNVLQPYVAHEFQLTAPMVGLSSSLFFYAETLFILPSGLLLDRISQRLLTSVALCVSIGGVFLMVCAHTVYSLLLARLLMGLGAGLQFAGCVRILVNWLKPNLIGRGMGVVVTIGILGGVMAQTPFAYLVQAWGWREALFAVGVLGLIVTGIAALFVPNHPKEFKFSEGAHTINALSLFKRFKLAFLKKQNLLCGFYVSLMNLPLFMLGAMWGISYLVAENGMTTLQASSICSMLFIGAIVGSPLSGLLSDHLQNRTRPMQWGALLSLVLIVFILFLKPNNFGILLWSYFLLGLIPSIQVLGFSVVIESNSKGISSTATSVISMLSLLGGAISQPLFGALVSGYGYSFAILLLPLGFVLAWLLSFFIQETHCKALVD